MLPLNTFIILLVMHNINSVINIYYSDDSGLIFDMWILLRYYAEKWFERCILCRNSVCMYVALLVDWWSRYPKGRENIPPDLFLLPKGPPLGMWGMASPLWEDPQGMDPQGDAHTFQKNRQEFRQFFEILASSCIPHYGSGHHDSGTFFAWPYSHLC